MTTQDTTKLVDCPEHPGEVHAKMYLYPSEWAGIWECPVSEVEDSCEHPSRHIETTQVDYWPTPDIDRSYDVEIYVCDDCELTIEGEDPAADRADDLADMEYDRMRDDEL